MLQDSASRNTVCNRPRTEALTDHQGHGTERVRDWPKATQLGIDLPQTQMLAFCQLVPLHLLMWKSNEKINRKPFVVSKVRHDGEA